MFEEIMAQFLRAESHKSSFWKNHQAYMLIYSDSKNNSRYNESKEGDTEIIYINWTEKAG